ncbi:TolC family protein [Opitutaceae bacterium EW11]|nr:TolC family protein [Opitutaceae bacterium EW11]
MKSSSNLRKAWALCSLVVLTSAAVFAAERPRTTVSPEVPDQLDLRTAIQYALDNNYAIRQARERIREQEGLIVEVRALALPNASVDSSYSKNAKELSSDRGTNNPSTQNWQIALNVRQTLYAGGGVRAALDAQAALRSAALLDLQATINTALYEVRTRFYNAILSREQIKVQEANVQLLQEQLTIARNRFEAGASSNFEVLRAEVAVANAQPALIRARNGYRTSIDELRQSLGYNAPKGASLTKVPELVGTLDFTPVSFELASALSTALANRPELQRLTEIEKAREAGVRNARSGYLPDLALVGGYEFRKSNYSNRFNDSLDGWTVGLQSSWAVFDGMRTRGLVAQAKSQLTQARLTTDESTLAVEVDVRRSLSSLQEAAELADAAKKTVGQAEEALRLADARYAAGTVTQLDVLQARVDLTQSRLNQIQANYSYNVAVATMRRAIGQADPFVVKP